MSQCHKSATIPTYLPDAEGLWHSPLILTNCSVSHCLWPIWGLCIPARTPSIIQRRWRSFDFKSELTERAFTDIPAQLLRGRPGSLHVLSPEANGCPLHRRDTPQSYRQTKLAFLSLIQIQITVLIFLRWQRACWEPLQFLFSLIKPCHFLKS